MATLPKVVVVLGPTASGKSGVAVEIAKKFNGEIISADSRQVYRELDIATGKVTEEEMEGIPHHLLDVRDYDDQYDVATFKKDATDLVHEILARNKLPIIEGGTGYYIASIVKNVIFPEVEIPESLKVELENTPHEELLQELNSFDNSLAERIQTDNRRRLERAIALIRTLGHYPTQEYGEQEFDFLQIGTLLERDVLRKSINERVDSRIDEGMIEEARNLYSGGMSLSRMRQLGLEFKFLAGLIDGTYTLEEFKEKLKIAIWHYAKRQLSWFKRDTSIVWISPFDVGQILKEVETFISDHPSSS